MANIVDFTAATAHLSEGAPQEEAPKWKPDDDNIALELVPFVRETLAHFYSDWRGYENGVWRARHPAELRRYMREKLRKFRKFGVQVNQRRITSIVSMLEDELYIPDHHIGEMRAERAQYINLQNGLFNLDNFKLEPHRRELYFTSQLGFEYDPRAKCPTFRRYIEKSLVWPDGVSDNSLVNLVVQALGYSMTARTDLKASFWLVGERDSGKSTFISVIKALMGDLHTTVDLTQLATNRFLLAPIVGKRVVTFTEASEGSMLDDAKYKTLTGGTDEISADVKNRDPIVFRPECKIWWAMNGMPRISDRSGATTRRITIIPFNRSIPANERILNLEEQLKAERPGIFNWAMYQLDRLIESGAFDHCEQSDEQMRQYIRENDTEATFIEQSCDVGEHHKVQGSELYSAYAAWCSENGFKPKNSNQVAKDWRRLGMNSTKSGNSWWNGLKIRSV